MASASASSVFHFSQVIATGSLLLSNRPWRIACALIAEEARHLLLQQPRTVLYDFPLSVWPRPNRARWSTGIHRRFPRLTVSRPHCANRR